SQYDDHGTKISNNPTSRKNVTINKRRNRGLPSRLRRRQTLDAGAHVTKTSSGRLQLHRNRQCSGRVSGRFECVEEVVQHPVTIDLRAPRGLGGAPQPGNGAADIAAVEENSTEQ